MRTTIPILMFAVIAASIGLIVSISPICAGDDTAQTTLTIEGMTCGGCVGAVKAQLKTTKGVTEYDVSLENGEALVTFDPRQTDPQTIATSVSKTGFRASVKKGETGKEQEESTKS